MARLSLLQLAFWSIVLRAISGIALGNELPVVSGYAMSWSFDQGVPAEFALSGIENPEANLNIYDVHYKPVASLIEPIRPQVVAETNIEPWVNGLGFESQPINLPDLHSGVYFLDGPAMTSNRIPFLVNNHNEVTDVVVIYPTNTVNAYSETNDVSLYTKIDGVRPKSVSFLRPQDTGPGFKMFNTRGIDRLLMQATDYTYKYISDADLESFDAIGDAKLVIIPGHSEYWTENARRNFDQFVSLGGTALVMSGNAMFRKVGYDEPDTPTELTFSPRSQFTTPSLGYPTWESIGVDFLHGGNGSGYSGMRERILNPHDGWKILSTPSYLASAGVEVGDVLHAPSAEYDGVPYTECDPETGPVVDMELLGFHSLDLVAFENTSYGGQKPTCAAWIDFRKSDDSGRQITVGAFNAALLGGGSAATQRVATRNMIELLLIDQADFNRDEKLTVEDIDALSAAVAADDPSMKFDITKDKQVDVADINRWATDFAKVSLGDTNLDGVVNFVDFLRFSSNFGAEPAVWSQGNFDGDSKVGFGDFLALQNNFASSSKSINAVPEPGGRCALVMAMCYMFSKRRRRMQRVA